MIKVLSTRSMPDNAEKMKKPQHQKGIWYNNVRYEVIDRRTKKILLTHADVCYSGMSGKVASVVGKSLDKDLPDNLVIRYYCKDGHNKLRFRFIVYVVKMFNRYFKEIKVYWSKEKEEIMVDVICKKSTPVEVTFMFGQFLRLSWEQFHEWKLDSKSYLFNHLYEALGDDYAIHIPTLLVLNQTRKYNEKQRRLVVALMIKQIKAGKVFDKTNELGKFVGKGHQYVTPYIQEKVSVSVSGCPEFQKFKLPPVGGVNPW